MDSICLGKKGLIAACWLSLAAGKRELLWLRHGLLVTVAPFVALGLWSVGSVLAAHRP